MSVPAGTVSKSGHRTYACLLLPAWEKAGDYMIKESRSEAWRVIILSIIIKHLTTSSISVCTLQQCGRCFVGQCKKHPLVSSDTHIYTYTYGTVCAVCAVIDIMWWPPDYSLESVCCVTVHLHHIQQDHGKREQALLNSKAELQKRLYASIVQPKMAQIIASQKANCAEKNDKYREVSDGGVVVLLYVSVLAYMYVSVLLPSSLSSFRWPLSFFRLIPSSSSRN